MEATRRWDPMLSSAASSLAQAGRLPGGNVYEPKWDGYRGLITTTPDGVVVHSRRGTNLTGGFPDIAAAVAAQVPLGWVLDGELVAWHNGRVDFGALAPRLARKDSKTGRLPGTVAPASFLVFDVLVAGGVDVRERPLAERRALLETAAAGWSPPLQLTPQTSDPELASAWFSEYGSVDVGVEGLVVKGSAQPYRPGARGWVKVRVRHTHDVHVGAVIGPVDSPFRLVVGTRDDEGRLRVAGATHKLTGPVRRDLGALLVASGGEHPWPTTLPGHLLGRLGGESSQVCLVVPDLVVEVEADTAFEHGRWRHLVHYRRVRTDAAV